MERIESILITETKKSVGYIDLETGNLCDFRDTASSCEALEIFKASYIF